ncbi:hypothetical protein Ptr902_01100 [Pyrenophora tritici-repentis]|nr:hypothetical protein Ptr902_01100 [Pyrenophora tritici-repentis]
MAPIITQRRSTERTAAPSYSRRALSSHNDVSLAIGLTVSLVCFVVILVAVWCLLRRRRIMRLGATPVGLESPVDETFSPVVEICSNSTKSLYKYEGDSPSYYSPLSPVAPLELDAGTPRSDVSPFSQYPPVSNSLSRYTPTNGESSSASKRTSPFSKEYYFTEPDHRSHPINTGFGSAGTGSSRYPRKQDINVQINFVNPRDVEYRPNRVLQAEEHAIYLSSLSLPSRGRPASIYNRPPYYIGMDASNIDTTNKGSQRTSPSPLSDRNSVQRISTLRESLQDLHRLSIIDVPSESSHDHGKSTQKQEKRRNQRSHMMETSSSTSFSTPLSYSNKSSPISTTTSPASSTTPSSTTTSPSTTTTTSHSPTSPSTPVFQCPSCRLTFRTPGLRRNHHNRRHNLRYTCIVCTAPFGLRADLDRHQYTRHPEQYRAADRFWCTVEGCENPGKEWSRKDNFERHVRRCEGRGEGRRAKGKERVG